MEKISAVGGVQTANRYAALQASQEVEQPTGQLEARTTELVNQALKLVEEIFQALARQLGANAGVPAAGGQGGAPTPVNSMMPASPTPSNAAQGGVPQIGGATSTPAPTPAAAPTPAPADAPAPAHADAPSAQAASPASSVPSQHASAPSGVKPQAGQQPPEPTAIVDVDKPIIVKAGETFDGQGKYFRPTAALGDGGVSETQSPVFILGPGATLKNVQYSGADGVHLLGDAKLDHVVNRDVGEDAITIDGDGNRAHDAQLAGISLDSIPKGKAKVEIDDSSFYHAHDKVIQTNGDADVALKGLYAEDIGQLMVTRGGYPITANVSMQDSTIRDTKYDTFRFDSRNSTLAISNSDTGNTPLVAMMGDTGKVTGTDSVRESVDPV